MAVEMYWVQGAGLYRVEVDTVTVAELTSRDQAYGVQQWLDRQTAEHQARLAEIMGADPMTDATLATRGRRP